jgi:hypothetical protein
VGSGQWAVVGRRSVADRGRECDAADGFDEVVQLGHRRMSSPFTGPTANCQAATQSIRNEPVEPARSLSWRKPSTLAGVANQNWNERVIRRAVNKLPLRWVQSIC